ncbi:MAG: methyl-accepting chemotaxis protein, partial [Bilophila sp.]
QSLALKEDMQKLNEQSQSISQIMGVISDIADQTNLLALNAAIEAARAGEAGRGFAVVADEVRKLAEKTMASTTDVGNAIRSIQQSAAESMTQVDNSAGVIEEATDLANQSGVALQDIVTMVDNTADQVRAIATASEQQSASSEEINQSITQVNTIAGETARAMEEAAKAVSDLAGQAQVLTGLIEDMKQAS